MIHYFRIREEVERIVLYFTVFVNDIGSQYLISIGKRRILPWDMVDNSINPLRTHFGLIFSSFGRTIVYFIL